MECIPEASKLNDKIFSVNRELRSLTGFSIRRLFPSTKREIGYLKLILHELENTLYFISIRKSPRRCLICGSEDIFQIKLSLEKEIEH